MTTTNDRADTASEVSVDRDAVAPKDVTMEQKKNDFDELDIKDPYQDNDSYDPSADTKKNVDHDSQGREKIRVNIGGGARRTVNTESMNAEQFDRFKSAVKARKSESGEHADNDIDIQHLSEMLQASESKHDLLEEQKMIHSEMRQQILRLTSIMGFQTVVIFALIIIVAWLFKDQFVEDGVLKDSDGNTLKVGSADFNIASDGTVKVGNSRLRQLMTKQHPYKSLDEIDRLLQSDAGDTTLKVSTNVRQCGSNPLPMSQGVQQSKSLTQSCMWAGDRMRRRMLQMEYEHQEAGTLDTHEHHRRLQQAEKAAIEDAFAGAGPLTMCSIDTSTLSGAADSSFEATCDYDGANTDMPLSSSGKLKCTCQDDPATVQVETSCECKDTSGGNPYDVMACYALSLIFQVPESVVCPFDRKVSSTFTLSLRANAGRRRLTMSKEDLSKQHERFEGRGLQSKRTSKDLCDMFADMCKSCKDKLDEGGYWALCDFIDSWGNNGYGYGTCSSRTALRRRALGIDSDTTPAAHVVEEGAQRALLSMHHEKSRQLQEKIAKAKENKRRLADKCFELQQAEVVSPKLAKYAVAMAEIPERKCADASGASTGEPCSPTCATGTCVDTWMDGLDCAKTYPTSNHPSNGYYALMGPSEAASNGAGSGCYMEFWDVGNKMCTRDECFAPVYDTDTDGDGENDALSAYYGVTARSFTGRGNKYWSCHWQGSCSGRCCGFNAYMPDLMC